MTASHATISAGFPMNAFGLPDPIPVHREPIYTPRVDLVAKYPTLPDAKQFRVPNIGFSVQKAAVEKGIAKQFPLILSSGRLVEYEGGGEETRTNPWLAELQQDMNFLPFRGGLQTGEEAIRLGERDVAIPAAREAMWAPSRRLAGSGSARCGAPRSPPRRAG